MHQHLKKENGPTLYDLHREVLEPFWEKMLELGRLPKVDEYKNIQAVRERLGSPQRAQRLFIERGGSEELEQAKENRINDLLVYFGLANFQKSTLQTPLRQDEVGH